MTDAGEVPVTARMWLALRDESWLNSERLLAAGGFRKAGEMAWGAVAQALHALAVSRGKAVDQSHAALKDYARWVGKEVTNPHSIRSLQAGREAARQLLRDLRRGSCRNDRLRCIRHRHRACRPVSGHE